MKWIPFFRGGKQTDSNGVTKEWTEEELDKIVNQYNAETRTEDSPIVVGHPKDNSPAFGWIAKLKRVGDVLLMLPKQISEEFKEAVAAGHYKYVSAAISKDLKLRHVGFLGGAAPAVKGLGAVIFAAENEFAEIETEFSDYRMGSIGRAFGRLRDWMIEKFDLTVADSVLPDWLIDELKQEPIMVESEAPAKFSEKIDVTKNTEGEMPEDKIAKTDHEATIATFQATIGEKDTVINAKDAEIAALKAKLAEEEKTKRQAELTAFCASLAKDGQTLTPKSEKALIEFMTSIADVSEFEFAEGDGVKKATPLEKFKSIITGGLEYMDMTEVATSDKAADAGAGTSGQKLAAFAEDIRKKNNGMTYTAAFNLACSEHPELAAEYKLTLA